MKRPVFGLEALILVHVSLLREQRSPRCVTSRDRVARAMSIRPLASLAEAEIAAASGVLATEEGCREKQNTVVVAAADERGGEWKRQRAKARGFN